MWRFHSLWRFHYPLFPHPKEKTFSESFAMFQWYYYFLFHSFLELIQMTLQSKICLHPCQASLRWVKLSFKFIMETLQILVYVETCILPLIYFLDLSSILSYVVPSLSWMSLIPPGDWFASPLQWHICHFYISYALQKHLFWLRPSPLVSIIIIKCIVGLTKVYSA